jgi:hypothetical protein
MDIERLLDQKHYSRVDSDFDYLLRLRMDTVSNERVQKILNERDQTAQMLADLRQTTAAQLWMRDLEAFKHQYTSYKHVDDQATTAAAATAAAATANATTTKQRRKAKGSH